MMLFICFVEVVVVFLAYHYAKGVKVAYPSHIFIFTKKVYCFERKFPFTNILHDLSKDLFWKFVSRLSFVGANAQEG